MVEQADLERNEQIAGALSHLLENQDAFLVRKNGSEVHVKPVAEAAVKDLRLQYPDLYGRLLALSQQCSDTGAAMTIGLTTVAAVLCLAVHMEWFKDWFGLSTAFARSIWVYGAVLIGSFFLGGFLGDFRCRRHYLRFRETFLKTLENCETSPYELITLLEEDESVVDALRQLKRDDKLDMTESPLG